MAEEQDRVEDQPMNLSATALGFTIPNKEDTVRRALAEGITDADKIAEWVKRRYGLKLQSEEIEALKKSFEGSQ